MTTLLTTTQITKALTEAGVENFEVEFHNHGFTAYMENDWVSVDFIKHVHNGFPAGLYVSAERMEDFTRPLLTFGMTHNATFLVGDIRKEASEVEAYLTEREVTRQQAFDAFEAAQGYAADPQGPLPRYCHYCDAMTQYVDDHECYGTRGEAHEAKMLG